MRRLSAYATMAAISASMVSPSYALFGGPFDLGWNQNLHGGTFQAIYQMPNGNGISRFTVDTGSQSGASTLGGYNTSYVFYRGIIYRGNAVGVIDPASGYATGMSNGSSTDLAFGVGSGGNIGYCNATWEATVEEHGYNLEFYGEGVAHFFGQLDESVSATGGDATSSSGSSTSSDSAGTETNGFANSNSESTTSTNGTSNVVNTGNATNTENSLGSQNDVTSIQASDEANNRLITHFDSNIYPDLITEDTNGVPIIVGTAPFIQVGAGNANRRIGTTYTVTQRFYRTTTNTAFEPPSVRVELRDFTYFYDVVEADRPEVLDNEGNLVFPAYAAGTSDDYGQQVSNLVETQYYPTSILTDYNDERSFSGEVNTNGSIATSGSGSSSVNSNATTLDSSSITTASGSETTNTATTSNSGSAEAAQTTTASVTTGGEDANFDDVGHKVSFNVIGTRVSYASADQGFFIVPNLTQGANAANLTVGNATIPSPNSTSPTVATATPAPTAPVGTSVLPVTPTVPTVTPVTTTGATNATSVSEGIVRGSLERNLGIEGADAN